MWIYLGKRWTIILLINIIWHQLEHARDARVASLESLEGQERKFNEVWHPRSTPSNAVPRLRLD